MAKEQQVDKYVEALHREIDIVADHIDKANRRISQIHYGGGSPYFIGPFTISKS